MDPLHFVFTDLPGPDGRCQFVDVDTSDGKSINVGEWRWRPDGLVELIISSLDYPCSGSV